MSSSSRSPRTNLGWLAPYSSPTISDIDYLDVADHLWFLLAPLMHGHAAIYQATGGRIGGRLPGLPSLLLLDHRGARSGTLRTTPLVYMPEGDGFLVVASKGGHPRHPAWLHNLRAHPEAEVQVGSTRVKVRAREADLQERLQLWPRGCLQPSLGAVPQADVSRDPARATGAPIAERNAGFRLDRVAPATYKGGGTEVARRA